MIEQRIIKLINGAIDSELSASEQIELDEKLAMSSSARHYYTNLKAMTSILDDLPTQAVPHGLHDRISSSITLPGQSAKLSGSNITRRPGQLRYGLAVAAGVLVAVGVYQLGSETGPADTNQMIGTIASGQGTILGRHAVVLPGLSSSVTLKQSGTDIILQVELDSIEPVVLSARFLDSGLRFKSVAQIDSGLDFSQPGNQEIRMSGHGKHRFSVLLSRAEEPGSQADDTITLEYFSAGELIQKADLIPQWAGDGRF